MYGYGTSYIEEISTGDTLVLPWAYRDISVRGNGLFSYAQDSIQFANGIVWDMNNFESFVKFRDVSLSEFAAPDPILYAWQTPDLTAYVF